MSRWFKLAEKRLSFSGGSERSEEVVQVERSETGQQSEE